MLHHFMGPQRTSNTWYFVHRSVKDHAAYMVNINKLWTVIFTYRL